MWWMTAVQAATLDEAWEALRDNPDRIAIAAQAEAADARVAASRAAWLPKVQVSGAYTVTEEEIALDLGASLPESVLALTGPIDPIVVQPRDWWQASATVVVPLVDLDGWLRTGAAARAGDAAEADAADVQRRLRLAVAEAYFGLAVAREAVEIATDAVAVAERQEDVAQRLVAAGSAVDRTALEATGARFAAQRDLQAAIAAEIGASEALHRLTGLPRDTQVELAAPVPVVDADRPDLAAARSRVQASERALRAAGAGWAPDVSARATALRNENQGLADDPWFLVGAVEATWTFDGGYRAAQAREARATRDAAQAAEASLARAVEQERAVALAERERAGAALQAAEGEVAAATVALAQAEAAFASGAATFVEVERAALGLRAARLSLSREGAAVALAEVRVALAG